MKLRNCLRCGRLFAAVHGAKPICPDCVKQEQAEFESVRDYLKEHPKAPLFEVSQATGVSTQRIMEYVRQGRLELGEPGAGGLVCERCGKPIVTGRLCDRCTRALVVKLREKAGQETPQPGSAPGHPPRDPELKKGRVHLADRIRRTE